MSGKLQIPTIETDRLILRAFQPDDAGPLHRIMSETGIMRYFPGGKAPTREGVERLIQRQLDHWAEHGCGWWAVALKSDPEREVAGWNGLQYLPETDEMEIGYLIRKDLWLRGLTTEAAQAGLCFGFETLRLETIIAVAHPENCASLRVMEKIGMTSTGLAEYFGMQVHRSLLNRPTYMVQQARNNTR